MKKQISPFSSTHKWRFERSPEEPSEKTGLSSFRGKEAEEIKMIGQIGVIGSVQVRRMFGWSKGKLRQMVEEKKLVKHQLHKNKDTIPVFTVSQEAGRILHVPIRKLDTQEVVRKIITFQFLCALKLKGKKFQIHRSIDPFVLVQIKKQQRLILVIDSTLKGAYEAIRQSNVPIIVITELLEHVKSLNDVLNNDTRLLIHDDLNEDYRFYRKDGDTWRK